MKSFLRKNRNALRNKYNSGHPNSKITVVNKGGNGVKWTDVAMVIITGILAFYTWQLFNTANTQSIAAINASNAAVSTFKEQRHKDSLDSVGDIDKEARTKLQFSIDTANQRKQFRLDSTGTEAQINSLKEQQSEFILENQSYIQVNSFDTIGLRKDDIPNFLILFTILVISQQK